MPTISLGAAQYLEIDAPQPGKIRVRQAPVELVLDRDVARSLAMIIVGMTQFGNDVRTCRTCGAPILDNNQFYCSSKCHTNWTHVSKGFRDEHHYFQTLLEWRGREKMTFDKIGNKLGVTGYHAANQTRRALRFFLSSKQYWSERRRI